MAYSPSQRSPAAPLSHAALVIGLYGAITIVVDPDPLVACPPP